MHVVSGYLAAAAAAGNAAAAAAAVCIPQAALFHVCFDHPRT